MIVTKALNFLSEHQIAEAMHFQRKESKQALTLS